jgi:hypothetical protein
VGHPLQRKAAGVLLSGRAVPLGPSCCPYLPECVEGKFSEVELPLYGVLRSWLRGSAGGIMLVVERELKALPLNGDAGLCDGHITPPALRRFSIAAPLYLPFQVYATNTGGGRLGGLCSRVTCHNFSWQRPL